MEATQILYFTFLPLIFLIIGYKFIFSSKKQHFNLPPSPPSLPIIGHLHLVKPPCLIHHMIQRYGPIVSLRLMSRHVIVVSSSSLVPECYAGQNDIALSNRPYFLASKYIAYNNTTVATAPYGSHWRNGLRIFSLELLSSHRLNNFLPIRKDEIRRMLTRLSRDSNKGVFAKAELRPLFSDLTFNNIVRMVTGKRYYGEDVENVEEASKFKKLVEDALVNSGANQPADYFPIMKYIGRYEKKVKEIGRGMNGFFQQMLEGCRGNKDGNTMTNHLLSLQKTDPQYYSDAIIKGLMQAMIVGGTDTLAVALEWTMSALIKHPEVLEKARSEIDEKIGQDRLIDEPDISNLPYLQNIVFETLRLYPMFPLLLPRVTAEDIKIGGYDVPSGSIFLINAWAINREPELWSEPERFNPERFDQFKGEFDVNRLRVFGGGRRVCPGAGLAKRTMALTVGSLIQCFDWKKCDGEDIDMSEVPGLALRKKVPLRAMCRSRPIINKILAQPAA